MIDQRFKEGQDLKSIYFPEEGAGVFTVGINDVEKITVVHENGQMAGVPWFAVWKGGKVISKWNAAMMGGCEL